MAKAYIAKWKYLFNSRIENAASWKTREEAQNECVLFDTQNILIPSSEGGMHLCKGFKVEQRQGEFVIYYEGPFVIEEKSKPISS